MSVKPNCYIEFRVIDTKRFEILLRFFDPLKKWTQDMGSPAQQMGASADDTIVARVNKDDTQESGLVIPEETRQRSNFGKPEEWLLAFRPKDLEYLRMPTHADSIRVLRDWQGLSRRERRRFIREYDEQHQLQQLADFIDMMRHWQDVEYELVACEMHESDRARITYSTFDYPFEGKLALETLLMFFGFFSIIDDGC